MRYKEGLNRRRCRNDNFIVSVAKKKGAIKQSIIKSSIYDKINSGWSGKSSRRPNHLLTTAPIIYIQIFYKPDFSKVLHQVKTNSPLATNGITNS